MGTTASGAPSNAVVVDDSWPGVRIDGKWTCWATPRLPTNFQEYWYNNTATETSNEGDSLKFMFYGPSIWYVSNHFFCPELTSGVQGVWHQVLLRRRIGCLCRREQNGSDQLVRLRSPRLAVVDQKSLGLEARAANKDATVPSRVFRLWWGVSINRFLPVRPPCPLPLPATEPHVFPRTLSSPVPDIPTTTSPAPSPTDNGERDGDFYDGLGVRNASAIIAGVVGGTLFVLLTSLGTFAWKRLFALS